MAPKLFIFHGSPPCRAVLITAKALGIPLDIEEVLDSQSPEYLKVNPQRKVPALIDDGKIICDSHVINAYLVGKYGKDDSLYPKDLYKRALVDERLYFDAATLFADLVSIWGLFMNKEIKSVPPQKAEHIKKSYGILEKYLEGHQWVTGDHITIADISLVTTITTLEILVQLDSKAYPNITAWIKRAQALPWLDGDDEEIKAYLVWHKTIVP